MSRYKDQSWPVRVWRWLRWRPWYILLAWGYVVRFACDEAFPLYKGLAECKMGRTITLEELKAELGLEDDEP